MTAVSGDSGNGRCSGRGGNDNEFSLLLSQTFYLSFSNLSLRMNLELKQARIFTTSSKTSRKECICDTGGRYVADNVHIPRRLNYNYNKLQNFDKMKNRQYKYINQGNKVHYCAELTIINSILSSEFEYVSSSQRNQTTSYHQRKHNLFCNPHSIVVHSIDHYEK